MTRRFAPPLLPLVLALAISACRSGGAVAVQAPPPAQTGADAGGTTTGNDADAGSGTTTSSDADAGSGTTASNDAGPGAPPPALVVSLAIAPASLSVPQGAQQELTATATWSDGAVTDVTAQAAWSISDAAVATLSASADGLRWARGLSIGAATISATYSGQAAAATLSVTAPALVELAVSPAGASIAAGTSLQLTAAGLFTDGSRRDVTAQAAWASSDAALAAAGTPGLFTGTAPGSAVVSAALSGLSASAALTVTSATLASIQLSPADASIAKGTSQPYTAIGIFTDFTTQDLSAQATWSSSQPQVAALTGNLATGASTGSATISAAFGGISGSVNLTVTDAVLSGIEISPSMPEVAIRTGLSFTADGLFSDGSVQDVTAQVAWSSSDPSVASIDAAGAARALAAGATTIAGSLGGFSDATQLTVTPASLVAIAVGPADPPMPKGTQRQLTATGTFSDGSSQDLTAQAFWTTSDPSIATVSPAGNLSAVAPGSVVVSAALLGIAGSATLTVSSAVLASIAIAPANPALPVKFWMQLSATGTFSDGSTAALTGAVWTSSDTAVAGAGATTGVVSGLAAGTATITAQSGGVSGVATLTVMNTRLASIAIAPDPVSLAAGASIRLTATGAFANGFSMDVTAQVKWSTSNRNVAWAGNAQRGLVRGVAPGSATVTASRTGKSGSVAVTVY